MTFLFIDEHFLRVKSFKLLLVTKKGKWALAREKAGLKTPALDMYTQNITKDVIKQRLDPVIGRDDEINSLVKVLGRRRKNNPVLVGEAGVGKTACAEGHLSCLVLCSRGCFHTTMPFKNVLHGITWAAYVAHRLCAQWM